MELIHVHVSAVWSHMAPPTFAAGTAQGEGTIVPYPYHISFDDLMCIRLMPRDLSTNVPRCNEEGPAVFILVDLFISS